MISLKFINPLLSGLFLIIWANDAYFIFGNAGKQAALVLGFFLVVLATLSQTITKREFYFFCVTAFFFILYFMIGHFHDHYTVSRQQSIFGIVCFVLLNAGYITSKSAPVEPSNGLIRFYTFMVLLGSYMFYTQQSQIYAPGEVAVRGLGDDYLNPVGIAYTHGLLLLFMIFLFLHRNGFINRISILLAILSTLAIIISTASRGAFLYLAFILILYSFKGVSITGGAVLSFFRFLIFFLVLAFIFVSVAKNIPFLDAKVELFSNRLLSLFNSIDQSQLEDRSILERQEMHSEFFKNIDHFIFGMEGYHVYPHNQFLEIIMRWGIFGIPMLIFSIFVFLTSFRYFNKNLFKNHSFLILTVFLFYFSYLQSMSSLSLEMNRPMWFGFGFLLGFKGMNSKQRV